jgi:hypothetical protein
MLALDYQDRAEERMVFSKRGRETIWGKVNNLKIARRSDEVPILPLIIV